MFRHERPQAGRLRQFHQFGVESFGTSDPRADIEVIALLWRLLSDLALPDLTLEINSFGKLRRSRGLQDYLALVPLTAEIPPLCKLSAPYGNESLAGAGLQGAGLSGYDRVGAPVDRSSLS